MPNIVLHSFPPYPCHLFTINYKYKKRKYTTQTQLSPCKVSHHSNGALIASSTKTHAIEVASQNYNKTTMCWDSVPLHSPKSLSRRAFDHPQPIGREGLLTCLLHLSLQIKSIMVSAVSQMPQHIWPLPLCYYISSQRTFKHLYFTPPQKILNFGGTFLTHPPISRNLGGLLNHPQYPIPRNFGGLLNRLHASDNMYVLHLGAGVTAYVVPDPVIPTR